METHSSILAWRIPWTEEFGRLHPRGHKESDTTERFHFHYDPMDYMPGSSVHVILQGRILERVVISFSRESSLPRDRTHYLLQWKVNSLPLSHL